MTAQEVLLYPCVLLILNNWLGVQYFPVYMYVTVENNL